MIDWNKVKRESVEAVNEIIDNGANSQSVILVGEFGKDLSKISTENWKSLCEFYISNYKLACSKLKCELDDQLILKAHTFISDI